MLLIPTASPTGHAGPVVPMKQISQPHQPESATTSPELLANSSQETCSLPEQTKVNSQVSDSSKLHRMMLKYSDEDVTNEELRELNLHMAAQQYMMQQDAPKMKLPHFHFSKLELLYRNFEKRMTDTCQMGKTPS